MPLKVPAHMASRQFEWLQLPFLGSIILATTASMFVASSANSSRVPLRAFAALDGNFTPSIANSSRPIRPWRTHHEHPREELHHDIAHAGNEGRQSAMIRLGIAGDGHEQNVLEAGTLHGARTDDAARVSKKDDLEQDGGRIGRGAADIVAEARFESGKTKLVVDQAAEGEFEGAW